MILIFLYLFSPHFWLLMVFRRSRISGKNIHLAIWASLRQEHLCRSTTIFTKLILRVCRGKIKITEKVCTKIGVDANTNLCQRQKFYNRKAPFSRKLKAQLKLNKRQKIINKREKILSLMGGV